MKLLLLLILFISLSGCLHPPVSSQPINPVSYDRQQEYNRDDSIANANLNSMELQEKYQELDQQNINNAIDDARSK